MTIKRLRDNEKGSILILTMLALVGAISIAVAMSSISIVERKMTTKSRKSTTAFQSANSGIEWAMKMINDAEPGDTISLAFGGEIPDSKGQIDCPDATLFSTGSNLNCKITFLRRDSVSGSSTEGERIIIAMEDPLVEDIVAIRSAGTFGTDTERVGRALEAYAMPNCGNTSERVADFCIDKDDHDSDDGSNTWGGAVTICESSGKRLCTAAELVAANQVVSSPIINLLSADVTGFASGGEYAIVNGSSVDSVSDGTTEDFRCCRNR
jgi:hypothetical protein